MSGPDVERVASPTRPDSEGTVVGVVVGIGVAASRGAAWSPPAPAPAGNAGTESPPAPTDVGLDGAAEAGLDTRFETD